MAKQLDRTLGYWSVVSISVGAMLGSGIFVLPGLAAVIAGPWVGLSCVLAGIFILKTATREEAEALMASYPAVKAGRFTFEVLPWWGPTGVTYDDAP